MILREGEDILRLVKYAHSNNSTDVDIGTHKWRLKLEEYSAIKSMIILLVSIKCCRSIKKAIAKLFEIITYCRVH